MNVLGVMAVAAPLLVAGLGQRAPASWCAAPRPQEPLIADAVRLGTSAEAEPARQRKSYGMDLVARDAIAVVTTETSCHQAATSYWSVLRKSVPDQFGGHPDAPVLVVQVGSVLLVDDLRSRDGRGAYWGVMVFDKNWRRVAGYGGGALPNNQMEPTRRAVRAIMSPRRAAHLER